MLKRSIIGSGLLHIVVIAAATIAWPSSYEPGDESPPVVPIELVEIAEVSNIAPTVREPPRTEVLASLVPPALRELEVTATPPRPVEVEPPPPEPPKPEALASVAAPKLALEAPPPEPVKVPTPPEQQTASKAPANPTVPRRRPQPNRRPNFNVDSVLALLDKRAATAAPAPANATVAEQAVRGIGAQNAFTLDLKDALLSQMRGCWNVPAGAPNPEKLIVQVRVFLAPDGSLARPPTLEPGSRAAAASDGYMRAAAEAALRAVNVCEPYKRLPPERYDTWREIVMTFDPSKMIGR